MLRCVVIPHLLFQCGYCAESEPLRITSISRADNCITLTWNSRQGAAYHVIWTDAVGPNAVWRVAVMNLPSGGTSTSWSDCQSQSLQGTSNPNLTGAKSATESTSTRTKEELTLLMEASQARLKEGAEYLERELRATAERMAQQRERMLNGEPVPDPTGTEPQTQIAEPNGGGQALAGGDGTDARFYRVVEARITYVPGALDGWGYGSDGIPYELTGVIAVSASPRDPLPHSLALLLDGTVVGWGDNSYGQAAVPEGLEGVVAIAAGGRHNVALKYDGTVVAWGTNKFHQLEVPDNLGFVVDVKAGLAHTLALRADGTVTNWGDQFRSRTNRFNVVPEGLTDVAAIAAGPRHCLALRSNGTVVAWGFDPNFTHYSSLLPTNTPMNLNNVVALSAGIAHNQALLADGTVRVWGLANYPGMNMPANLAGVRAIAAGWHYGLALMNDGTLTRWGQISGGEGMNGVVAVSAGAIHTLVIRTNLDSPVIRRQPPDVIAPLGISTSLVVIASSSLPFQFQWQRQVEGIWQDLPGVTTHALPFPNLQDSNSGQYRVRVTTTAGEILSRAATVIAVHPPQIIVQTPELELRRAFPASPETLTIQIQPEADFQVRYQWFHRTEGMTRQLPFSIGPTHPVYIGPESEGEYWVVARNVAGSVTSPEWTVKITFPGEATTWGSNANGLLEPDPEEIHFVAIAAGHMHSIGLRENGTVAAWGDNSQNQLNVPPGLTHVVAVAAGYAHSLALREDGTLVAWGYNDAGQGVVPPNATEIVGMTAGYDHNLALKADGTVLAWGNYTGGALDVPNDLGAVAQLAAGQKLSYALLANGTVRSWGTGENNIPITVPPNLTDAVKIAAAYSHALVLRSDGTVTGLGVDSGAGETIPPGGLDKVLQVAVGYQFSLAVKNDGAVVPWGRNDHGQTQLPSELGDTKMVAAGGLHALALAYDPVLMYPVNVSQDLLVIWNTNCPDSVSVKDHYLAHRPHVSGANVLGIGGAGTVIEDYINFEEVTDTLLVPIVNWLENNPTKRPSHYLLCYGIPNRTTYPGEDPNPALFSSAQAIRGAVPGRRPFVMSLNMATVADCTNYIDKVAAMGANLPLNAVHISATAAGYETQTYVLDNVRDRGYTNTDATALLYFARKALVTMGTSAEKILYADNWNGVYYEDDWPLDPDHLREATNVTAYVCYGQHGFWPADWPTALAPGDQLPYIRFHGDSAWHIMQSVESWNGRWPTQAIIIANQSSYQVWFCHNAFGGSNYSNTPVGAVSHVSEPQFTGVNETELYFGLWHLGKSFAIAAWYSDPSPYYMQATGDPFVKQ